MGKLLLIVNPAAGKAKAKESLLTIVDTLNRGGWQVEVYVTGARLDAAETAAARGGEADLLVCVGGDGTLSETISGMMRLAGPPPLGYIPAGSTNDFASSLGIPRNAADAARNVLTGTPVPIDIGRFCGSRYFVYVAAFGIFTEVSYTTPQENKNLLGHQAYMIESVKSLANIKSYRMKVESDACSMEEDFIYGMVTNTVSVGGFKGLVSGNVSLDDGLFEVLLVRTPTTPMDLTNILSSVITRDQDNEYVHRFSASKLRITCAEPVDWVLDGEFGGAVREAEIENLTKRIKILAGNGKKR